MRIAFFISLFMMSGLLGATASYEAPYVPLKCVKVYDAGTNGSAQHLFRFYNGCGENVFIDACIKADDGSYKHYTSGRKVPTNGNFTIYTFPFVKADQIVWTASTSLPRTPPPCKD